MLAALAACALSRFSRMKSRRSTCPSERDLRQCSTLASSLATPSASALTASTLACTRLDAVLFLLTGLALAASSLVASLLRSFFSRRSSASLSAAPAAAAAAAFCSLLLSWPLLLMRPEISEKALSISAARRFCCSSSSWWPRKPVPAEAPFGSNRSKHRLMYELRSSVKPDRGADKPERTAEAVRGRGSLTPAVRGRGRLSSTAVAPRRWPVLRGVLRRKCGDDGVAVGRGRLAVAMLRSCRPVRVPALRSFPVGAVAARSTGSMPCEWGSC